MHSSETTINMTASANLTLSTTKNSALVMLHYVFWSHEKKLSTSPILKIIERISGIKLYE